MGAPATRADFTPLAEADLDHVDVWVFDLDNTLYPHHCRLFDQIDRRMGTYIQDLFGLDPVAARHLQKSFLKEHGTTLRGLMDVHGVDPAPYLDFVHEIDLSPVAPDPVLDATLARLPGRKMIFTNGTVDHAARVTDRLGITHHFQDVFDIAAADFRPKPEPGVYRQLVELYGIAPERAVLFEDSARNLAPAADMGMTTVWVESDNRWAAIDFAAEAIHYVCRDLTGELATLADRRF